MICPACKVHHPKGWACPDQLRELERKLAETKEGWRLGIEQHRVNVMPETEAAVHIAELERDNARLREAAGESATLLADLAAALNENGPRPALAQAALKIASALVITLDTKGDGNG